MPKKAKRRIPAPVTRARPLKRAAGKKPAAGRKPAAPKGYTISLASPDHKFSFSPGRELDALAVSWSYRLRNRLRWKDRPEMRARLADECLDTLLKIGIDEEKLRSISKASLIEVAIPWQQEAAGWEARIFPWEFVLSNATRKLGRSGKLTVIRQLDRRARAAPPRPAYDPAKSKVLFVESAPGILRDEYDFDAEREMVQATLGIRGKNFVLLKDPTLLELESCVKDETPDLIHLAGFDTHQAFALLKEFDAEALTDESKAGEIEIEDAGGFERDGYVLSLGRRPDPIGVERLARALSAAKRPPAFVGCNIYDSALRTAPVLVAGGAGAALGFRDFQDDTLMEMFFSRFYRAWKEGRGDALAGFAAGWEALRNQPKDVRGTSVALWSARSCLQQEAGAEAIRDRVAKRDEQVLEIPAGPLESVARVELQPKEKFNYALLHNRCSLFERFLIHKYQPGRMTEVSVEVALAVGSERFIYQSMIEVVINPYDLSTEVCIPLAWALAGGLHEEVRSTIFVEVKWKNRVLKRATLPVTLLPVGEWHDTLEDDKWLPSFVLPRDPAVLRIISAAQRYLVALDDDPGAGFDGYQSEDAQSPGPATDRRVQAIWHALTQDLLVSYSEPPPVNTPESQRLRTPSEILNGERGTCIDLALMFAACLELVGIYPVIFVLDDHAFPGYWRDEAAYEAFADLRDGPGTANERAGSRGQTAAWFLGNDNFEEIRLLEQRGKLVPLETVDLTSRSSFAEACEDGRSRLRSKRKFLCMLDVTIARKHGVTPLPFPEDSILADRS
ncbi:MAG: hypothetical protein ABIS67_14255 [Candidatus Eisenbacteria bacterium]